MVRLEYSRAGLKMAAQAAKDKQKENL